MSGSFFFLHGEACTEAPPLYSHSVTATTTPDTPEHFNCGCYYPAILAPDSWASKPTSLREVNYEKVTELSLHCPHNHGKYRENVFILHWDFFSFFKNNIWLMPDNTFYVTLTHLIVTDVQHKADEQWTDWGNVYAAFTIYKSWRFQQRWVLLFFSPP